MKKMHKKILNRWNYLVIVTVAFFLLAPSMSPAQTISGQKTQVDVIGQSTIRYTYQISKNDLMFDTFMGYDRVQFKDCQFLNDIGKPFLPYAEITIALPSGTAASQVRVIETKNEEINGKYTLFPAQPLRTMNDIDKAIDLVEPDAVTYASKQKYPVELAKFVYQTDLRGQGMAVVQVFPLQYTPGEKKLTIYTSITLEILGTQGYVCGDYLPQQTSEAERTEYKTQIMNMVVNPKDVNLVASDTGKDGGEPRGVPAGNYKYVIITKPTWVSYFQPLADWKTKKGMKATIVTTDWIYSTYTGADNQEKINAFVQDAHSTWSATFFLLGGDIDTVPVRLKYYSLFLSGANEEIYAPADTYYADYDGDFLCEVNVGRASVTAPGTGVGQIQNFINKIFTYEQNPPLTNYAKTAAMFGFNLDAGTLMETCKIAIDTAYIPADWTMSNVYDSMTGDHETAVKLYVNAGQHLINHGDHCNEYEIGVGVINHWLTLTPGEVDGFSNGNKQSIMYSMGCYPAAFDVSNCIAEHFVRDNNGGGIAFVGNSRYGIYVPGVYTTYSCRYDREFFEAIFEEERYILGEAFSDSKDESPHNDDYYRCIFDELNLLGDPQLPIWTNNPVSIVVTHPATLPTGPSSYTVHVTSGGSPVYLADVCLWKGTDIYLTGTTNSAGDCTFNPSPTSGGSMYVTVTKHNYLPYMGQATVPFHNPPYIPNNPGPADLAISVSRTADLNWTGGDPDGNPVTYDVYFGTTNPPTIKVSPSQPGTTYDPATMDIWTTYYWQIVVTDIDPPYSQSVSGPIWQFRTQDTVYPEWRNQGQSGPTVPPGGSITLSTQGRDNIGLDYAYLSTNESGQWVAFSGANWWDINWDYCKPIVIDHNFVDIDQTNFPVLITCTSPDFISHAQPDGDDFVFVNATNTTVFNHEIESYNSATGELIAWVTIPLLSASEDTVFYMYYGNPDCVNQEHVAETWNGNFITVQHMTGATYTALDDSSSNHWDITSMSGNPLFNQIGKIGKCVDFDGSGDYLKASGFRLPADPSYTACAWVYVDGGAVTRRFVFEGDSDFGISLLVWDTNETFKNYAHTVSGGGVQGSTVCYSLTTVDVANPQWHYIGTRANANSNQLELLVDGTIEASKPIIGTIYPETEGLNIGTDRNNEDYWMNGKIDELRISNVVRSDAWIKTEYNNMVSPVTFATVSGEISRGGGVKYGSPLDLTTGADEWVWSNFTWQNPAIASGTIGWRIQYVDLQGNTITTNIMSFTVSTTPPPVLINGSCFYTNMSPVNNLNVEIRNLNTNRKWQANTAGNYYSLELTLGLDINASETLRVIAKDNTKYVNVTDHLITTSDISTGRISHNLILNIYYLDLKNFPMYSAQPWGSYTNKQFCGPAVLQMMLNYMWWNSTTDPTGPPRLYDNQTTLYTEARAHNYQPALQYLDTWGMYWALQTKEPLPYHTYHYNFAIEAQTTASAALSTIALWIDYQAGIKPGHPTNVPATIPAYGDYSNWMAIRGIHTNRSVYPGTIPATIYGLWVNDPSSSGLGENTYKTASEFISTYFLPMNVAGDYPAYNGKYISLTEPPVQDPIDLNIAPAPRLLTTEEMAVAAGMRGMKTLKTGTPEIIGDPIADAATQALINLAQIDQTVPTEMTAQKVFPIEGTNGLIYYLVTFTSKQKIAAEIFAEPVAFPLSIESIESIDGVPQPVQNALTGAAVIVNPDGSLAEISIPSEPLVVFQKSKIVMISDVLGAIEYAGFGLPDSFIFSGSFVQNGAGKFSFAYAGSIGGIGFTVQPDGTVTVEEID